MQLREFAERVLFADTLAEKLAPPPPDLADDAPGDAIGAPGSPGRPADLRLTGKGGSRAPFPGDHRLIDDEQRGILMHFFANHELLATELMALVLLKFPDAPKAFRRDILTTLKDEQIHTQWYLKRMAECGVDFGSFRLSGFFWEAISTMETPLDYVTRLSLTFEQANLDFSKHYAKILTEAGDPKTGKILERIYRDEIAHVGYGLKWFRRWKQEGESDWQAFNRKLHFPLSPSRAKARNLEFNREGRRRAGIGDEFIRELKVYNRSTGRSPNVFFFNPDAENNIAGVTNERDTARQLALDLEILIAAVSRRDDIALVRRLPSIEHLAQLSSLGFDLPEFEQLAPGDLISTDSLTRSRKLARLKPWAWSPKTAELLAPLERNLSVDKEIPWGDPLRAVFSKTWDLERLAELGGSEPGVICRSMDEVMRARAKFGDPILIKAPLGASGQRNHRFDATDPLTGWVGRTIDTQGCVIVEPYFDRIFDFSAHYERDHDGLRLIGFVRLENTPRGQFLAASSGGKFGQNLPAELGRFLMGDGHSPLHLYRERIREVLETALADLPYRGPIGVDAFVYRDGDGHLALRPIAEVNPRYTMGRVAHEIRKKIAPEHCVRLEFHTRNQLRNRGFADFASYLASPGAGAAMNDPQLAEHVLAELTITKTFAQLPK
jgi:uncharacterized ferritin-like protein (DUF455 family)